MKSAKVSWFLPHHRLHHNNKARVVFNCSFTQKQVSLNTNLLPGPTLSAPLLCVLLRFREHAVAMSVNIRGMFIRCNYSLMTNHSSASCGVTMWKIVALRSTNGVLYCLGLHAAYAVQPTLCSAMCKNTMNAMKMWFNWCSMHFTLSIVFSLYSPQSRPECSLIRWESSLPVEASKWGSGAATCLRLSPIYHQKWNQQNVSYGWLRTRPTHRSQHSVSCGVADLTLLVPNIKPF